MKPILLLFLALLTSPLIAKAHGEDKPGPNGGFIRMPGAFHTEAVPVGSKQLKIFLLDIEWKNPTVVNSSVKATHVSTSKKKTDGVCKPKENYFDCVFDRSADLTKSGKVEVEAQRNLQKGIPVSYPLPLKLEVVDDGHRTHH